ncbi:unnamed protein product [Eruca vesicaria subsp. sativa]|uniref:Uncharacterized protein n=1 Tax=Eruca vesicaria subsp. sativa TaxID=29727 RepID=A0ABC8J3E9_ERUVS|nr:unnamed protein product [Eruca vesicaria subsp. sativa]
MSNSKLASLHPYMLQKILSKVATNHIWDFGSARVALPPFNQIGREEYFYKSADLIHFNDWIDEVNAVRTYMLKCYQAGNPHAIDMRVWDFCNDIHLTVAHWPIKD